MIVHTYSAKGKPASRFAIRPEGQFPVVARTDNDDAACVLKQFARRPALFQAVTDKRRVGPVQPQRKLPRIAYPRDYPIFFNIFLDNVRRARKYTLLINQA